MLVSRPGVDPCLARRQAHLSRLGTRFEDRGDQHVGTEHVGVTSVEQVLLLGEVIEERGHHGIAGPGILREGGLDIGA